MLCYNMIANIINKQGNFYYSLGKLNYYSNSYYIGEDITPSTLSGLIMYTEKPTTVNPLGWQQSLNQRASVYVEDIKFLDFFKTVLY